MNPEAIRQVADEVLQALGLEVERKRIEAKIQALRRMGLDEAADHALEELRVWEEKRQTARGLVEALQMAFATAPSEVRGALEGHPILGLLRSAS